MKTAGTPAEIVKRLHAEMGKALAAPDVKKGLLGLGIVAAPSESPAAFASYIAAETKKWAKVVKDAKIKAD